MSTLFGVMEMYVRAGPDVLPHRMNGLTLARTTRAAGMRALLLKSHDTITVDLPQVVESAMTGVRVFRAVTLNDAVRGFNTAVVHVALARSPKSPYPFTDSRFLPPSGA